MLELSAWTGHIYSQGECKMTCPIPRWLGHHIVLLFFAYRAGAGYPGHHRILALGAAVFTLSVDRRFVS